MPMVSRIAYLMWVDDGLSISQVFRSHVDLGSKRNLSFTQGQVVTAYSATSIATYTSAAVSHCRPTASITTGLGCSNSSKATLIFW